MIIIAFVCVHTYNLEILYLYLRVCVFVYMHDVQNGVNKRMERTVMDAV